MNWIRLFRNTSVDIELVYLILITKQQRTSPRFYIDFRTLVPEHTG